MRILLWFSLLISIHSYAQTKPPENFKKSTIKIGKVRYDVYKGTLPVQLNRSDSSAGFIFLPVQIIQSTSKNPAEPVYNMEGGPGKSNLSGTPPKALLANHDLVTVGYRGMDAPEMKKSKKLNRALRGLHHRMFSDESLENAGKAMKEYAHSLAGDGIDINNFTIMDVVDDFEDIRKQLGHRQIYLYSGSYGTRVALLYSYRYPDEVKRSFMYGINPPGRCVWYPEDMSRIIRTYDSLYMAQFGKPELSIEASIRLSFERMPKRWTFFKLDADKIRAASFFLMFTRDYAVCVFDVYKKAALKGDYSGLYLMQVASDYAPGLNYGDLFGKAISADFNPAIDYRALGKSKNNDLGAPGTALFWGVSKNWPIKQIDEAYRKTRLSNTETLLVSGSLDVSDPPWVPKAELLPWLPNGKQVILKEMAHCPDMSGLQHDAFVYMVQRFIDDGIVDTSKFKHDPVNFTPKKNFNRMAKWYYPVVFVLSLFR
jgi:pimeloyl-ACP methyl ester carboxylesterase